ncbi:MAG: hypothetical protein V4635_01005 [Bacteroidota bacterium]
MKRTLAIIVTLCLVVFCFVFSISSKDEEGKIKLRFNPSYRGDTITKQKTGLLWALSFLGAELPKNSFEKGLTQIEGHRYELNIDQLGFNEKAVKALNRIFLELKASEEYKTMGGIDLGGFIVYTVGSSWHYYEITGAEKTFVQYKNKFGNDHSIVFPVLNSSVAKHHRMIRMNDGGDAAKMSFIAEEGHGDIDKGSFKGVTHEVYDIMKNGQLRFAIYGADGELKDASEPEFSVAGKPVKCLWCHEINIIPLLNKNTQVKSYIDPNEFQEKIKEKINTLELYREKLNSDIDFKNKQDHTLMELLYISYMQPSIFRLAHEWNQPEKRLESQFEKIGKTNHYEFPFLSNLLARNIVNAHSPYATVLLPDSVREHNNSEPNVFRQQ